MVSRVAALCSLRVLDGPAQTVEPVLVEEVARPTLGFACAEVAPLALHQEAMESLPHVGVDLVELGGGVPGAEVIAPTAQHRVHVADQHPHVLDPVPASAGHLLHALSYPLHAARRRPALEEVDASPLLLPDWPAQP